MSEIFLDFIRKTQGIEESDYGDFMRKENLYFLDLRKKLGSNLSEDANRKLDEMQDYLQFKPSWNRPQTEHRILEDIETLQKMIEDRPSDFMQENAAFDFHQLRP